MSSSRQNHISSAPSYPGLLDNSSLWEENYRQRVRKMTRDYVNPNSTRLSHKRSLSADSRPQYNNGRVYKDNPASSSSEQFNHRAQGLNVFYPTLDESRARVVYDANGPQFPSQLPKPVSVDQTYFERTGRSLSPSRSRGSRTKNGGSRIYQMPSGLVDPFESSAGRLPSRQSVNPTLVITPKRHNFDFLKDSLIMFGDEASSMGTGASQQELLQERDKEQTGTRRNEKKERKRILNLPSTLFPSQPIRKQPQTSKRDTKSDFLHEGTDKEISPLAEQYVPPPLQFHSTTPASYSGSFDRMDSKRMVGNPDLANKKVHNRIAPATRNPGNRIGSFDERDLRRTVGSPDPPANRRSQQSLSGRNSAMVRSHESSDSFSSIHFS